MSIELENPKTLVEKIDAAANYVAQMLLAKTVRDDVQFEEAHARASRLLFEACQMAEESKTEPDLRAVAVNDALAERTRQDAKWGQQDHDPITWSAILTEECGELAEAALHHRFGGPAAAGLRTEAVQVAAVALQIVECLDRNGI